MLLAFWLALAFGSVQIPLRDILTLLLSYVGLADASAVPASTQVIIEQIRLPRVISALFIGWTLAVSGGVMQGIFRNPLASPYLLGIASGASVGAAIVIVAGMRESVGTYMLPIGAFLGGSAAVLAIYGIASRQRGGNSEHSLILAGIALGAFFSAITSFLIFLSGDTMREIIFWIMGSTARARWDSIYWLIPIVVVGTGLILYFARDLNALALGDEGAHHLGVRPERTKRILLAITTLITGAAVAVAGTIGFIGLITPHAMRLIVGPDQRILLPASALAGAIFLLLVDAGARTVMEPAEIPIGILSAFIGAPFFLYLLMTRKAGLMR